MKILPAVAAIVFLFAVGAFAETTNDLSEAEIQGRNLAHQLYYAAPEKSFSQNGILIIRSLAGSVTNVPVIFDTQIETNYWELFYVTKPIAPPNFIPPSVSLNIFHKNGCENEYRITQFKGGIVHGYFNEMEPSRELTGSQIMSTFSNSDFWLCDLGLEFFHWPEQKILKHEMKRGRSCQVLESTNPNPSANGYSRVVSWIDNETLGIVHAEAYDFRNKLLKEFDPKSFKKVNGQWELQEMEIRNVQTGSRSRLEFDVKKE
jgi:hypothetical protein